MLQELTQSNSKDISDFIPNKKLEAQSLIDSVLEFGVYLEYSDAEVFLNQILVCSDGKLVLEIEHLEKQSRDIDTETLKRIKLSRFLQKLKQAVPRLESELTDLLIQ